MQTFDDTLTDQEFQQHMAQARAGWMDQATVTRKPDLGVEGLRGSLLMRLFFALQRRSS
jgi:hypothetical protein